VHRYRGSSLLRKGTPPQDLHRALARLRPTVGSKGVSFSYERVTPVRFLLNGAWEGAREGERGRADGSPDYRGTTPINKRLPPGPYMYSTVGL
jgi:hypothetical protein